MRLTAESLGLENCVAETNRRSRSGGLRPHDLRHHAITKLAESPEASEQTIRALAGHVSREIAGALQPRPAAGDAKGG